MAEIRVTIIGGQDIFRELLRSLRRCVAEYNKTAGTNHEIGEVVIQPGIGGVDRFPPPDILLSTARVGDPLFPTLTFEPIAIIMRSVQGVMHRRIFLIDEITNPVHRESILQFFHMAGLGDQLYFCHSLEQDYVDNYRMAVFVHLLNLLDIMSGEEDNT